MSLSALRCGSVTLEAIAAEPDWARGAGQGLRWLLARLAGG